MTKLELPEGLIAVPLGGRPPKIARDVAVWLGYFWQTEHKGERSKRATAWVMEHFGLTGDDSQIRRSRRKAQRKLGTRNCLLAIVQDSVVIYVPTDGIKPIAGATGWAWTATMLEAVQVRVTRSEIKA